MAVRGDRKGIPGTDVAVSSRFAVCTEHLLRLLRSYCLSMKAEDHTGNVWMTAFDDTAKELLGFDAQHVQNLKDQSDNVSAIGIAIANRGLLLNLFVQNPTALNEFNAIFEEVSGRDFVFRLAAK